MAHFLDVTNVETACASSQLYGTTVDWFWDDPDFGVKSNVIGFNVAWASGMAVVVQASTDLGSSVWIPLTTNTLVGGSFYFSDPEWTNYPARFYRIRSL